MAARSNNNLIEVGTSTIVRALLVILGFAAIYYLKDVVLVVLLSVIVASAIEPGTRFLMSRHVPRLLSVLLMYSVLIVIIVGVFYFLFLPILNESVSLLSSLPSYLGELRVWDPTDSGGIFSSGGTLGGLSENFSLVDIVDQLDAVIQRISTSILSYITSIFGGILSSVLVIVLSFYLSMEHDGVTKFLRIAVPSKHESYVIDLWRRSQKRIGLWMQGQIVLAVLVAILVFLGLTILRVPNPLVLAVIAGVFEIIPLFGPVLAAVPAVAIALLDGGITPAVLVIGLYIIIQQFENQLLYPLVVKKVVGVSPIVSILALVIGAKIAGFIGLLVSVPIASALMEFLTDVERDKLSKRQESHVA